MAHAPSRVLFLTPVLRMQLEKLEYASACGRIRIKLRIVSDIPAISNIPPTKAAVCAACGQRLHSDDHRRRNHFYWGLALAWLSCLPIIVGLATAFRGISQNKATGIGAVAGGLAEMGIVTALAVTPACLIAAIVLLARSFSTNHPVRLAVGVVSLCWTVLMMSLLAFLVWLLYAHMPRH